MLIFTPSGRKIHAFVGFGGIVIESVLMYKYLGITLFVSGSFTQGINELAQKGGKTWYSLRNNL